MKTIYLCSVCSVELKENEAICDNILCLFISKHDSVKRINNMDSRPGWIKRVHVITNYYTLRGAKELHDETLKSARTHVDTLDPDHNEHWRLMTDEELLSHFKCPIWPNSCVNFNHKKLYWEEYDHQLDVPIQYIDGDGLNTILDISYPGEITKELLDLCEAYRKRINELAVEHFLHVQESSKEGDNFKLVCNHKDKECHINSYDGFITNYNTMRNFCDNIHKKHASDRIIVFRN